MVFPMDYAYHGDFVWVSVYFPHSNSRLDRLVLLHVTSFCTIVLFTNKTQFQYFHGTSFVVLVFSKKTVYLREYHYIRNLSYWISKWSNSPVTAVSGRGCWSCFPPIGVLGFQRCRNLLSIYLYILHHTSRECYVQHARQCILKVVLKR